MSKNNIYLGNPLVRGADIQHDWTKEELIEYNKCLLSPKYFAKNYCKVIHLDRGLVSFDLYPYQEVMFDNFLENRFNVVLSVRQSGKSVAVIAFILWCVIFKGEQVVGILANKGATAREMLGRLTLMLENLPFFLQPGCKALNKSYIEFCNNSRIIASATSASSVRSHSMNLIYLDEFAFVEQDIEFYTSTYPVISSGKTSKVIITSTHNNINCMFYKIYEKAIQGVNEYVPFRVDWWEVPGRDEEWKRQTIANTSQSQFDREFGNTVNAVGNTLINAETLLSLSYEEPISTTNNIKIYKNPKEEHNYVMTVDVSHGRGQDFSTFTIIDITSNSFNQVCVFRDNVMSPLLFPDIIFKYAKHYNNCYVIIENNDVGHIVCNGLHYELEYENLYMESTVSSSGIGVRMTKKTKRIGCSNIKDIIEQNKLKIVDNETIIEISSFIGKGKSYQAETGSNDDLMMNLVMFGWFTSTPYFQEATDIDMKELLYKERIKQIEDELIPIGIMGQNDINENPLGEGWEIWKG